MRHLVITPRVLAVVAGYATVVSASACKKEPSAPAPAPAPVEAKAEPAPPAQATPTDAPAPTTATAAADGVTDTAGKAGVATTVIRTEVGGGLTAFNNKLFPYQYTATVTKVGAFAETFATAVAGSGLTAIGYHKWTNPPWIATASAKLNFNAGVPSSVSPYTLCFITLAGPQTAAQINTAALALAHDLSNRCVTGTYGAASGGGITEHEFDWGGHVLHSETTGRDVGAVHVWRLEDSAHIGAEAWRLSSAAGQAYAPLVDVGSPTYTIQVGDTRDVPPADLASGDRMVISVYKYN